MRKVSWLTVWMVGGWALMRCTQAPQAPQAETKEAQQVQSVAAGTVLQVDGQKSEVKAIGTKVTGRHEVRFPIKEASLSVGEGGCLSGGKVTWDLAQLQVLDLEGEKKAKLEGHLKSPDFFDVEKHPEGVFEITGCEKGVGDTLYLSGNLTLRGVTKNIRFPAVVRYEGNTLSGKANFNINRQEWGIAYKGMPDDLIRDEVNIQLDITAVAPSQ
ncbi:MAG: hypothetical protein KatS3mg025_0656 [Bacteroidia bacterium]|nr:MAG: hypothetical protein KatS3mg025_0656 [Bacteroidia bacterium]